jgi:peptidoglycan/xylan/chitin deacetylase (PgdA/CDA1 family)
MELVPPHRERLFEAHMRHLAATYRVVPAAELQEAAASRRRRERFPVAVTFDDDLASHVQVALPVLRRTGLHATFFLSGASLAAPYAFWWERLQRASGSGKAGIHELTNALATRAGGSSPRSIHEAGSLIEALEPHERDALAAALLEIAGPDPPDAGMRAADVRALAEAGMEIGFHTLRHDPLTALSDAALGEALRNGKRELEELAGQRLRVVAYPHGRADQRVAAAARNASFELGYTGALEAVRPTSDRFLLGRISPSNRSAGRFARQIAWALFTAYR